MAEYFPFRFLLSTVLPRQQDRAGNKYGRIGSHEHTDNHGKSKIMDNAPPENKERNQYDQGGQWGQDRSSQGLVDAHVENHIESLLVVFSQIFPNTVKDNDRIVERITDNCQQRRNDGQCEVFSENRKNGIQSGSRKEKNH